MNSPFRSALDDALASTGADTDSLGGRRWVFVPYDQLSDQIGPLRDADPREVGIVVVESPRKAAARPYHQQKLALVLTNLRHFALEQAQRGVAVEHVVSQGSYADGLRDVARRRGSLVMMEAAERELRDDLAPLVDDGLLDVVEHEGWLSTPADFDPKRAGPPWRMDTFYRRVRKRTGLLLDPDGKPLGGRWSHDAENRQPWPGSPPAPTPPRFEPDAITREVADLVRTRFADHPGMLDPHTLPASAQDAQAQWTWAKEHCMHNFGPYEDAMSTASRTLFHTRISALVNLHRLLPAQVVAEVASADLPLPSKEGFIRQVLGWREFVRHVHRATDGFRTVAEATSSASDGGYGRWAGWPWPGTDAPGGSSTSWLGAEEPVPPAFWGTRSGMRCLDEVVRGVWEEGYGHHITRLMVLANLATLLDLSPREVTDWFWVAYTDAYDWVVEPNVLGMGMFAAGPVMTTKPYVSGAAYIHKMSDYCEGCSLNPKRSCPITRLYWAFLGRHAEALADNHRLALPLGSLRKRAAEERALDRATFESVKAALAAGEVVPPAPPPARRRR